MADPPRPPGGGAGAEELPRSHIVDVLKAQILKEREEKAERARRRAAGEAVEEPEEEQMKLALVVHGTG